MKKIFLLLAICLVYVQLSAQELKVAPTFSYCSYNKFQTNIGYQIGYNHFIKSKSRIGINFFQSFNNTAYQYTFISDADGRDYYRDVQPKNQRLALYVDYSYDMLNSDKSKLYLGPTLGLNFFRKNESGTQTIGAQGEPEAYHYAGWEKYKVGTGLLIEYEQELVTDRLALSFSTVPEIIIYTKPGLTGSSSPVITGWLNFNLSISFRFG